jgi:thiol-disulfide isomerase/thioredoxin
MKFSFILFIAVLSLTTTNSANAQTALSTAPSTEEQQALMQALSDGATSPMDLVRALEAHLAKYPNTVQRPDVEQALAKAAVDLHDKVRTIKYGEPVLKRWPDDLVLLDRVSLALLTVGGKENADRAYTYARHFEDLLDSMKVELGPDVMRRQDEHDRAMGRVLLYQARARTNSQEPEEAARLAARSFDAYPTEEAAREWAESLTRAGKPEEGILHMAEAFAIPDGRASEKDRLDDRLLLGEWYRKQHESEKGLGDVILAAYDRTSTLMELRHKKLLAMDPNAALESPMDFTLTALDGQRFRLSTLKGKVVVLDFWATWCVPCRLQHPLYEQLKQRFPESSGVVFLAINADEEHSVVEPFLEEQKWDKKVYFEDGLGRMLNVQNIPSTILFGKNGQLASRMDGFDPSSFLDWMTTRIQSILAAN